MGEMLKVIERINELNKLKKEDIKNWLELDPEYDEMKKNNIIKVVVLLRDRFPKMEWEIYRVHDGILEGLILSVVTFEEPNVKITFEWDMHFTKLIIKFSYRKIYDSWKLYVDSTDSNSKFNYQSLLPVIEAYISQYVQK